MRDMPAAHRGVVRNIPGEVWAVPGPGQLRDRVSAPARDPKQVPGSRTQGPQPGTGQFAVWGPFKQAFGHGTVPKSLEMAIGFILVDSQGLTTVLDPLLLSSQPGSELLSAG